MARTVTRSVLRSRARQLANVVNDPSILDADLNEWINLHLTSVYDLLVSAGPADYYAADHPITTVAGTIAYALPATFMKFTALFANESTDLKRRIYPMQDADRASFKAPSGAWSLTMEYIPACPTLAADGDTFDGVDGWDEIVSAKVAREILTQREGDPSVVMAIIAQTEARIRSQASPRDRGGPKMIVDVEQEFVWPRSVRVDSYRLRAGNIELYEELWGTY